MKNKKLAFYFNYISIVVSNLSNIILTIFLIKTYDINEYAVYTLIATLISIFIMFDLGLSNSIIKFLSPNEINSYIFRKYNLHLLYFLLILLSGITMSLYFMINNAENYLSSDFNLIQKDLFLAMMKISIVIILVNIVNKYFTGLLSSQEYFSLIKLLELLRVSIRLLLIVLILILRLDIISFVILDLVLSLILLGINFYYCQKGNLLNYGFLHLDKNIAKNIFYHAFFIFLISVMDIVFWKIGQLAIGTHETALNISIYSITMLIIQILLSFNSVVNGLTYPHITKMADDDKYLRNYYYKISTSQATILIFMMALITMFGWLFIEPLLGDNFKKSIVLFLILCIPILIVLSQSIITFILFAKGLHRFRAIILFISALSLVVFYTFFTHGGIFYTIFILSGHLLIFNILFLNIFYYYVLNIKPKSTIDSILIKNAKNIIISALTIYFVMKINNYYGVIIILIYIIIYLYLNKKRLNIDNIL